MVSTLDDGDGVMLLLLVGREASGEDQQRISVCVQPLDLGHRAAARTAWGHGRGRGGEGHSQ